MHALDIRCHTFLYVALLLNFHHRKVIGQHLDEDLIPDLYNTYKEAIDNDQYTNSLRRLFKHNKEYSIHVKKLKEVNGYKKHNLLVKENSRSNNPIIYINNPVESKIPNSYLTLEEFKKLLTERVSINRNAHSILHKSEGKAVTKRKLSLHLFHRMSVEQSYQTNMMLENIKTWATTSESSPSTTKINTIHETVKYLVNNSTGNVSTLLKKTDTTPLNQQHLMSVEKSNRTNLWHESIKTWSTSSAYSTSTTKINTVHKTDKYLGNITGNYTTIFKNTDTTPLNQPHLKSVLRAETSSNEELLKFNKSATLDKEENKVDSAIFITTLTSFQKPTEITTKAELALGNITNIVEDTSTPNNNNWNASYVVITDRTNTTEEFTHTESQEAKLSGMGKDIGKTLEVNSSVTVFNDLNSPISNSSKANSVTVEMEETPLQESQKSAIPNSRKKKTTLSTTTKMKKRTYNRPRVFIGQ